MNINLIVKEITKETFLLIGKLEDRNIINNLINFVKNNKNQDLSYKTNVKGDFTGFKSLIDNSDFHKFLNIIQRPIKMIYQNNFIIDSAWGNILKNGGEVIEHAHEGTNAFCGILYLSEGGPGTFFNQYNLNIEEEIGKFVLFSPELIHSVKKIDKDIERITIAFNMNELRSWESIDNITLINKNEI
jgi:hypothetical protein